MELYFVRHTTPSIGKGTCYGWSDVPLKETFEQEAEDILRILPQECNVVYTSPMQRCHRLAEKIGQHYAAPVLVDNRLKELNFGEWELKRWNTINKKILNKWMQNYEVIKCPGGESYREMFQRLSNWLDDLMKERYSHVVVVTHGGIIRAASNLIEKTSLQDAMNMDVKYGSIFSFNLQH